MPSSPWFNVVPNLENLCQAAVGKYDQANLQPILNKWEGGVSITIFATDCLETQKNKKSFLKTQNVFFFC